MSAISSEVKMSEKNMYEQFMDGELPPEIQDHVTSSADLNAKNKNNWWFCAGFFTALNLDRIRKLREQKK